MDYIYSYGITAIQTVQEWLPDLEGYLVVVNDLTNPVGMLEWLFPLVAIVDSVFAAQLLLVMAFGGWLTDMLKWWFLEHRPYWWIHITDFYPHHDRPIVRQFNQTCETSPGCPSGHTATASMGLVLFIMWISHVNYDRQYNSRWWKFVVYPFCIISILSVMVARMYVAAHFPHQVLLGAALGAFLAPFLCLYISDPFIWQYGMYSSKNPSTMRTYHIMCALATVAISYITYLGLKLTGWDPEITIKFAQRWCLVPGNIHVSSTPLFTVIYYTGHLVGWALYVDPSINIYRHFSNRRSLFTAAVSSIVLMYTWRIILKGVCKDFTEKYYIVLFILCVIKPVLFLKIVPKWATTNYRNIEPVKVD